jgi:hypothetical protein
LRSENKNKRKGEAHADPGKKQLPRLQNPRKSGLN